VTDGPTLDQATAVTLEYESGPLAQVGTSYFVPGVVSLAVYGAQANAWSEEDGRRLFTQQSAGGCARRFWSIPSTPIVDELVEFARCVRGDGTPGDRLPRRARGRRRARGNREESGVGRCDRPFGAALTEHHVSCGGASLSDDAAGTDAASQLDQCAASGPVDLDALGLCATAPATRVPAQAT
jgi:hypothetical protein